MDSIVEENLTPIKRALIEIRQLRARLTEAEKVLHEPIAIIGMGMRLPGRVYDAEGLERLLWSKEDAVAEIPPDRWSVEALVRVRSRRAGENDDTVRCFSCGRRSIRCGVFWHFAARGGRHGSAATAALRDKLGGA